jgi:EAL and modified HD-GYP domain-containing signal transduction protein
MSNEQSPFELLKQFPGIIHRQPLFITNRLDVDSYHFTFLDKEGNLLPNDAEVPAFLSELSDILPTLSEHRKTLLSIPASWRDALSDGRASTLEYTFVLQEQDMPVVSDNARFRFARHAQNGADGNQDELLLVDLQQHNIEALEANLSEWQSHHSQIAALGVNDQSDYGLCKTSEFDFCQGAFYTLPSISDRKKISPSLQTLTELLVKLQNPEIEAEELADTVNQDVALSYKLLRLINSAFFGLPREVSSTQQAIVMLGQNKIKTWASLLGLSGIDDKPVELRVVAMTRARMCELLAKHYKGQPDLFFAAGLFSTLDALMDNPLPTLIEKLPLSPELKDALLKHEGAAGQALRDTLNYEQGNWEALASSPIPTDIMAHVYLDALYWSKELNAQLAS